MVKWEYLAVNVSSSGEYKVESDKPNVWVHTNVLGDQGWELAGLDSTEEVCIAWFKRPKEDSDEVHSSISDSI